MASIKKEFLKCSSNMGQTAAALTFVDIQAFLKFMWYIINGFYLGDFLEILYCFSAITTNWLRWSKRYRQKKYRFLSSGRMPSTKDQSLAPELA